MYACVYILVNHNINKINVLSISMAEKDMQNPCPWETRTKGQCNQPERPANTSNTAVPILRNGVLRRNDDALVL